MRLFRDSVENLNVSRLVMSSKAEVGVGEVGAQNCESESKELCKAPVEGWVGFDSRSLESTPAAIAFLLWIELVKTGFSVFQS